MIPHCVWKNNVLISKKYGVFAPGLIDGLVAGLKKFDDKTLRQDLRKRRGKNTETRAKIFLLRIKRQWKMGYSIL